VLAFDVDCVWVPGSGGGGAGAGASTISIGVSATGDPARTPTNATARASTPPWIARDSAADSTGRRDDSSGTAGAAITHDYMQAPIPDPSSSRRR
jgi:hypothetical protein